MTVRRLPPEPSPAHRRVWFALLAALVACSGDASSLVGPTSGAASSLPPALTAVASVSVSSPFAHASIGTLMQFSAFPKNSVGGTLAGQPVTWFSSDSTILEISASGLAQSVGIGTVAVSASAANGVAGTTTEVIGGAPSISTIAVTPTQVTASLGQATHFSVTLRDSAGNVLTGRRVVWQSSNASVMQVDSTGNATPVAQGNATVSAFSAGMSASASVVVSGQNVQAPNAVTDLSVVSVTDTSATLQFTQPTGGSSVASFDVRVGSAPFTFGSAASVTRGSCATPVMGTGAGTRMICTAYGLAPATAFSVQLDPFVGTLNVNAVFGGLSNVASGTTLTAVVVVGVSPATAATVAGTAGVQFAAMMKDAGGNVLVGRGVTWTSNNTAVATVSQSGVASGISAGTVLITATSGSASGSAQFTVTGAPATVAAVTLTPATTSILSESGGVQYTATLKDSAGNVLSGRTVTWSSSNTAVATVNANGFATALVAGTAVLSATSGTASATAVLTVTSTTPNSPSSPPAASVATVTVTPSTASAAIGSGGVQYSAVLKDSAGNVLTGRPTTWTSGSAAIATVNASGLVTGVATGSTTITATSGAASGSASITVTAAAAGSASPPGTVTNLSVSATTATSATLSFTQVADGAGGAASYVVLYSVSPLSSSTAANVTHGTCAAPVAGTAAGNSLSCSVLGLTASTAYQFEVVAFRGTFNVNAVTGSASNIASGTTPKATVASVSVSPSTANVSVGGTVVLAATPLDNLGNLASGWTVSWSSNGTAVATVSSAGAVMGVTPGVVTITATAGGISGSATVTVISAPTSGGGSAAYPNQPAGFTVFAEHNFTAVPNGTNGLSGSWTTFQGGGTHLTLQSDPTAPQSPASVLQVDFQQGTQPGYDDVAQTVRAFVGWAAGSTEMKGSQEYSAIYESTWFRIPTADFETQEVLVKILGYWGVGLNDGNHVASQLIGGIAGNGSSTALMSSWPLIMETQNIDAGRWLNPNVAGAPNVTAGVWHQFETYMKLNDIGSANGIWQWWLDGHLVGSYSNVVFRTAAAPSGFWGRRFDAVWGGLGGASKSRTDNIWLDHMYMSGVLK